MAVKISNVDPRFIFNADETSIDSTKETKKEMYFHLGIVQLPTLPIEPHLTLHFLPPIGISGCKLTTLVIINTQSVTSELSVRFGFPQSESMLTL